MDLSENSLAPLGYAINLARRHQAEVVVMHVVAPGHDDRGHVDGVPQAVGTILG